MVGLARTGTAVFVGLYVVASAFAWSFVPTFRVQPLSAKFAMGTGRRRAVGPCMVSSTSHVMVKDILGDKPVGVTEPFKLVQVDLASIPHCHVMEAHSVEQGNEGDMRRLKRKIKQVIERNLGSGDSTHPLLKSSSKDFFERSEKTWRPMVALLLSIAIGQHAGTPRIQNQDGLQAYYDDAMVIAEIVEMMHTSTVIHDTVLEDFEALEKGNPAHRLYSSSMAGNKISILAGDFLLARASVLLASLRNTQVVEIMARALEAIMKGQMQLHRPVDQKLKVEHYIRNIEYRTANLIASGCQCAALVAGHSVDSTMAKGAYEFGLNIATAYQITRDMQVTEANYEKLWNKMQACTQRGDQLTFDTYELNEPLQRAGALIYTIEREPELEAIALHGFKDVDQLLSARQAIERNDAVTAMRRKACLHARAAIDALSVLPESDTKKALVLMSHYVVEPGQAHLQRANYVDGGFVAPQESEDERGQMWGTQLRAAKKNAQMGLFNMGQKVQSQMQRMSEKVSLVRDAWRGDDKPRS